MVGAGEFVAGALLSVIAALPLRVARVLGRGLGVLAWLRGGRSARVTRRNLELCYSDSDAGERARLARASLLATGAAIGELGLAWRSDSAALACAVHAVHGREALERAREAGRGLLVVAPHLGNWEVLLQFLQLGGPSTVLYRPPRQPVIDALAKASRTRFGMRAVPASRTGVRELLLALRRAETVVVLPDQEPTRGSGCFAPFFGEPAWTPVLPHALVRSTDCAVLLGWCLRVPPGFEIGFETLAPAFRAASTEAALTAMNHAIEQRVRAAPAQYQWEYKRFRTRPPGAPAVY